MDNREFYQVFKEVLAPDTNRVKAATAKLRADYYPLTESLQVLLQLLLTSDEPSPLRQLAATQARSLVPKHWNSLSQKSDIRQRLLQGTLQEGDQLVRHAASRVITAIAKVDTENEEWPDLVDLLLRAGASDNSRSREVGTYVLFTALEAFGEGVMFKFQQMLQLFSKTIQDPESAEVRINTMLALSRMAIVLDTENDEPAVQGVQDSIPQMVTVLKQAVDAGDDDRTTQSFEVFQTLLGCDSQILNKHFKDLVQFMINLAAEKDLDEDARTQAISFLMQCVRFRKLKMQGLKVGEQLTLNCLEIATELGDASAEDEEVTTPRSALGLLDILASSLPPSQVVVPLLHALGPYVNSNDPDRRQGGIMALGMCVEGAPDFIAMQLKEILPLVLRLLEDSETKVRRAALDAVMRLSEDLPEDMGKEHQKLIPALIKHLDIAMRNLSGPDDEKNMDIIKASCNAIDTLVDGFDDGAAKPYLPEIVPRLSRLFSHPELKVKAAAIGAIGSIAASAKADFLPYFEQTMNALSDYVRIKDSEDDLTLRATTCDAMANIALAVDAKPFQRYVPPLMQATEEGLHLDNPKLRETSFLFWGTMAKVYGADFKPYLSGVVKALFESLSAEETDLEVDLGEQAKDLAGKEVVVGGKKVRVASFSEDELTAASDLDDMSDLGGEDDEDWDDFTTITAVAQEKEIAVEIVGDILTHATQDYLPYLEKTIEVILPLVEHPYEGVRRAAISTLCRTYGAVWELQGDNGGKWEPGLPLQKQPNDDVKKLGDIIMTAMLAVWIEEEDRTTVTDINRNLAAVLRQTGPSIISDPTTIKPITETLATIITKKHACQQDFGDSEDMDELEETSEYDWLVIDTALDCISNLAFALGQTFSQLWKMYEKPIMRFASGSESFERSTAIGVVAECIRAMGSEVTPYTSTLLRILLHRMSDEDAETKSNAAFAIGLLQENSTNDAEILKSFNTVLAKLEPLLHTQEARAMDNAAGCVSRMVMRHQDHVPVEAVLPALVELLPLKEDFEENEPVFKMIVQLYSANNQTIIRLTPQLLPVLAHVLSPPKEQLKDETRVQLVQLVKFVASKQPAMVREHDVLHAVAEA